MSNNHPTDRFCQWLEQYLNYELITDRKDFSLDTMQYMVSRFNNPQNAFESIHVAGSKGKGSVSTMIASILRASGLRTGLYTSPHLVHFTERITGARGGFNPELYEKAMNRLMPLVESMVPGHNGCPAEPTWFELVTLFGFMVFQEAAVNWGVIETGMGGRLDATNVVIPRASVITPVELEHTRILGNTITAIAGEKAGIIKKHIPVFISGQSPEAEAVFRKRSQELDAPLFAMSEAIQSIDSTLYPSGRDTAICFNDLADGPHFERPLKTRLRMVSTVQTWNAALAAYTVKYLIPDIKTEDIEAGLSEAWLPGRFEICGSNPVLVLDGAHTAASIRHTLATFQELFPGHAHLLFACAADKDVESIAPLFSQRFTRIALTVPGDKKAHDFDRLVRAFTQTVHDECFLSMNPDWHSAIQTAIVAAGQEGVPLLVTGSFYLVSEVKAVLAEG